MTAPHTIPGRIVTGYADGELRAIFWPSANPPEGLAHRGIPIAPTTDELARYVEAVEAANLARASWATSPHNPSFEEHDPEDARREACEECERTSDGN